MDFTFSDYFSYDFRRLGMANIQRKAGKETQVTPAVSALEKSGRHFLLRTYDNQVGHGFAQEAATVLQIDPGRVFKTLIAEGQDKSLYVALVPTSSQLNFKLLAAAVGTKKVRLADQAAAERSTGFLKGGISPFGQKTILPTVLDESANQFETVFVSGGRRGLEIEIAPVDLIDVCHALVTNLHNLSH
jgi:Cys-tRNA(Pro)/Cys-tRNA(Cys) deacylase